MMQRLLAFGLVALLSGPALPDDARRMRTEVAVLVYAAENAEFGYRRRTLLERAHGKLLAIQELYTSESAHIQIYIGGEPVSLRPDDIHRMAIVADGIDASDLSIILGRGLSATAVDENGWTDLHWAAALNLPELAEELLDMGADGAARLKSDEQAVIGRLEQSLTDLGLFSSFRRKGYTPLHVAAFNNARDVAVVLIEHGADIDAKSEQGWTALHGAAWRNTHGIAVDLLERGADVHAKARNGWTALHRAAESNAHEVAAELIEHGADIHAKAGNAWTSLHVAARANAHEVALELLGRGADIHAKALNGDTPLTMAEKHNMQEVLTVLRKRQAVLLGRLAGLDVAHLGNVLGRELSPNAVDENGWTDLHYAAALNLPELAEALLDTGVDVAASLTDGTAVHFQDSRAAKVLEELDVSPYSMTYYHGQQPLHVAAIFGTQEVASILINRNANANWATSNGFTPLTYAVRNNRREVVELLLDHGANDDVNDLLDLAVQRDAVEVAALLVDRGAVVDSHTGGELLHRAASVGASGSASFLVDLGVDIHVKDSYGRTPLHSAVLGKHAPSTLVAAILIERGANVDAKNESGDTPLHMSAREYAREIATKLVAHGANIHAKNNNGDTPLHVAARQNVHKIVAKLVAQGADIHARNKDGDTPLTIAKKQSAQETLTVLRNRQAAHLDRLASVDAGNLRDLLGRELSQSEVDENGWTDLHYAAGLNLPAVAEALVDAGADVAVRLKDDGGPLSEQLKQLLDALDTASDVSRNGDTPLHIAALNDAREVAAELIERGADVHAKDKNGSMPLHIAAANNARGVAAELIEGGADVHAKNNNGDTALHAAARRNVHEIVAELVAQGADIHVRNKDGDTPLTIAEMQSAQETLTVLRNRRAAHLDRLASVDAGDLREVLERELSPSEMDENGWTDLHYAAALNLPAVTEALVDAGADVAVRLNDDGGPLSKQLKQLLDALDTASDISRKGDTPLHIAALNDAREAAAELIERGADVHAKDEGGWMPLHLAAQKNSREVAVELIERGADVHAKNNKGWMPLHIAAWRNAREAAAELIERGADVHAKTKKGSMPLHLAARRNAREAAAELIERGADVHAKNKKGWMPLHLAARRNAREAAAELIERGADVHAKNKKGWMPLHLAAWYNAREAAAELIERGADVHAKNKKGWMPLHIAAWNNARDVVAELIERGADIHAKVNGRTPLALAEDNGSREVLVILKKQQ